jgi:uncharacterized membrane protein
MMRHVNEQLLCLWRLGDSNSVVNAYFGEDERNIMSAIIKTEGEVYVIEVWLT